MFSVSTLAILILASIFHAKCATINISPVTLPLSRSFNFTGSAAFLERDRARATSFRRRVGGHDRSDKRDVLSEPISNAGLFFSASVGVGSPATAYDLLIDTGSSNTWLGSGKAYIKTSTSKPTPNQVAVTYGSGSFSGQEYTDRVTIAAGLVIPAQSIGVASTSYGFGDVDGILGLGPAPLSEGSLSPARNSAIPTVMDNLFEQKIISNNVIGISFNPTHSDHTVLNGELTWGGTDSSKFIGSIHYSPITTTSPSNEFWGIDQSITYGSSGTTILASTAGIVDTGTTFILLASDALANYMSVTGAVVDKHTGLLRLTAARYAKLQSLYFHIGGVSHEFTANAQIWPRALNSALGGASDDIYLIVNDLRTKSASGLDFINGYAFLERYYSVFDNGAKRVGFAATKNTYSTQN